MTDRKQLKEDFDNLSNEEKQKILDQVNEEVDSEDGNTTITSISEMEELRDKLDKMTPQELFDHNVTANIRACYTLEQLTANLTRKNMKKLLLALLRLPEENSSLKFGGTVQQKKAAEQSFIQAQVALNSKIHVIACQAAQKSRYAEEQKQKEQEDSENKKEGENNE